MNLLQKDTSKQGVFDRFLEVVEVLKNKRKVKYKDIAAGMGHSEQYFSRIKSSKEVSPIHIMELKEGFPYINEDYINKNQLPMFLDDANYEQSVSLALTTKQNKTLAIYDFDVQSGDISLVEDVSSDPQSTISFLGAEDCDFAVKVHGDSMTGKISNGGVIAVKELFDKDIIPYGHIFLIFTSDLRMVRYIKKSKKGDDYVKLSSNNNQFEDFEIKREKIIRLFMVKKILNDEA